MATKDFSPKDTVVNVLRDVKINTKSRNENQKQFWKKMAEAEIVFASGPAGCGKSYLCLAKSLKLLKDPNNQYEKLILITPAVESDGEEHGHLPGTLEDKLAPYLYSSFYLVKKIVGDHAYQQLQQHKVIETPALAFLRVHNIDNSILIFEEAQNSKISQMKTLLTRIGSNSKYFITGDVEQIDRQKITKSESGLQYALERLHDIEGIATCEFTQKDIVRNKIISPILDRWKD